MRLVISTPTALILDQTGMSQLRAEDASGSFGVLDHQEDLLTTPSPSVVTWRGGDGREHYCAIRGAVLTVSGGDTVSIAARDAVLGDDLSALEGDVLKHFREIEQKEQEARESSRRLHVAAIRQIMTYLRPGSQGTALYRLERPP